MDPNQGSTPRPKQLRCCHHGILMGGTKHLVPTYCISNHFEKRMQVATGRRTSCSRYRPTVGMALAALRKHSSALEVTTQTESESGNTGVS